MSDTLLCETVKRTSTPLGAIPSLDEKAKPWDYLDSWRMILAGIMLAVLENRLDSNRNEFIDKIRFLNQTSLWTELQIYSALQSLCCKLLELPIPKSTFFQHPNGSAPLEFGGHWAWAEVPLLRYHAELGMLWAFLGHMEKAEKLADWQLNALDHSFYPFVGLFSQESDGSLNRLLASQYLLFHSVAVLANRPDLEYIASRQLEHLKQLPNSEATPFELMCEAWIQQKKVEQQQIRLPKKICDSENSLVGSRTSDYSVVCSLAGGGTGLGALHKQGLQLVNYGPHRLPLGECQGFGIGSGRNIALEVLENGFTIQGTVPLASKAILPTRFPLFRVGAPSQNWLDIKQSFFQEVLTIDTHFLGENIESLAFAFFVKAEQCSVGKEQVKPFSFQRYSGNVQPVRLEGQQCRLDLITDSSCHEMQVIPLSGGENFWGASFLIAYILNSSCERYRWQVL